MNNIKIKQNQVACFERWVFHAIYIPKNIKTMLVESVCNPIFIDDDVHYKFNIESIEYLSKECPIHFMQKKAFELCVK